MDDATRSASQHLARELRRVVARLAVVRPPAEELEQAAAAAAQFADRLDQLPVRSRAWEVSEAGLLPRDFVAFSPVSGQSNPLAPPVELRVADDGIEGEVVFGPQFEGPPGHVHGGLVAAMFDEMLGFAQLQPGFTAYLKVDYRRPTPLNTRLELRAWVDRVEGRKRWIRGTCGCAGELLAEAEGLFIAPREGGDYLARLAERG